MATPTYATPGRPVPSSRTGIRRCSSLVDHAGIDDLVQGTFSADELEAVEPNATAALPSERALPSTRSHT